MSSSYAVKPGDTWQSVASQFQITVDTLLQMNNLGVLEDLPPDVKFDPTETISSMGFSTIQVPSAAVPIGSTSSSGSSSVLMILVVVLVGWFVLKDK
jgi:hypothetical protein